jgi:hypothetical protein
MHWYLCEYEYRYRWSDDDDIYLRLENDKGFHNLVYIFYVKHINPASKA